MVLYMVSNECLVYYLRCIRATLLYQLSDEISLATHKSGYNLSHSP